MPLRFSFLFIFSTLALMKLPSSFAEDAQVVKYIQEGKRYTDRHNYDLAERSFEKALDLEHENTEALFGLAGVRLMYCRRESAIDLSRKILQQEPNHAGAIYYIVTTRWQQGRLNEAHKAFNEYLSGIDDPTERQKTMAAESGLFTKEALGEFGRIKGLAEGECDPNDHCPYSPARRAAQTGKPAAPVTSAE